MNAPSYDKNFAAKQMDQPLEHHSITSPPFELGGYPWHRQDGGFNRLPTAAMNEVRKELSWVAGHGSGGVVRFRTDSPVLGVKVELVRTEGLPSFSLMAQSGVDVYGGLGQTRFMITLYPQQNVPAYEAGFKPPACEGLADYALYLPIINGISRMGVGVAPSSRLEPPTPRRFEKPIVFYGSSITEGCIASHPGNTYPAMVTRQLDAALVNMGYGGQARGDKIVAEAIAGLEMSAFVMDYDHNTPSVEHLQQTHGAFFQIIRRAQPTLPIVIVSSPNARNSPEFFSARRDVIRQTWQQACQADDKNVYFVDGGKFFPDEHVDLCYCGDRLHPNDLGFHYMAQGLIPTLRQALKC